MADQRPRARTVGKYSYADVERVDAFCVQLQGVRMKNIVLQLTPSEDWYLAPAYNRDDAYPPLSCSGLSFRQAQFKFCLSSIRQVKKSKDVQDLLYPVDDIATQILTQTPTLLCSHTAEEFVPDVGLLFPNSVTFDGSKHRITQMGQPLCSKIVSLLPGQRS
jgi:hypothetical protein